MRQARPAPRLPGPPGEQLFGEPVDQAGFLGHGNGSVWRDPLIAVEPARQRSAPTTRRPRDELRLVMELQGARFQTVAQPRLELQVIPRCSPPVPRL